MPAMDRARVTDLYFAEARSKLIDLAAFFDRIERSEGPDDFRIRSLRAALQALETADADKTKKVLLVLSDPTKEPVLRADTKPASGAWSEF
jgi:capsule polysaccharide export protein KpsE/RkpR